MKYNVLFWSILCFVDYSLLLNTGINKSNRLGGDGSIVFWGS